MNNQGICETEKIIKGTLKIAAYDEWYGPLYDCPYCGETCLWDNFKFCPMCGKSVENFKFAKGEWLVWKRV